MISRSVYKERNILQGKAFIRFYTMLGDLFCATRVIHGQLLDHLGASLEALGHFVVILAQSGDHF